MRITILDDDKKVAQELKTQCLAYFRQTGEPMDTLTVDVWTAYEEGVFPRPDILLLDIEMPDVDGLTIKERLEAAAAEEEDRQITYIIFVSAYPQYISEAFGRNVIAFLTKPVSDWRLGKALEKAVQHVYGHRPVMLENGRRLARSAIMYIQSEHVYTDVHTASEVITVRRSLKEWEDMLTGSDFLRISDRLLVNLRWVKSILDITLCLEDGTSLIISRSRKKSVHEAFDRYQGRMQRYV